MGIVVSAAQAAALVGRHERMVRWHIERGHLPATKSAQGRWQVNTDDLSRVRGWVVDRERLARLELRQTRSYGGLVARVEALEARQRALEAQQAALTRRLAHLLGGMAETSPETAERPEREDARDDQDAPDAPSDYHGSNGSRGAEALASMSAFPTTYRGPATVTLMDRGVDAPLAFRTRADAGRWLERHGVNALTPKTWPHWRHVELTPRGVLRFALARQAAADGRGDGRAAGARPDWRVTWRLHRCADPRCVCGELLTPGSSGSSSSDASGQ